MGGQFLGFEITRQTVVLGGKSSRFVEFALVFQN
jgi:hypothetical protein